MRIYTEKKIAWASWLRWTTKVVAVIPVQIGVAVAIQLGRSTMHATNVVINTAQHVLFQRTIKGNRPRPLFCVDTTSLLDIVASKMSRFQPLVKMGMKTVDKNIDKKKQAMIWVV
jgi:hypothetical protein